MLQNIYLQKTLQSISKSLEPRFDKVKYTIRQGETLEKIINKKAEEMDDPPVDRGTSTSLPKNLWTDIPEYKKIKKMENKI